MRKAIFLDRDGTLNKDTGYPHKIEDWVWLEGVIPALAALKKAGWLLIGISNQSGIGRGYFSADDLLTLEKWLNKELTLHGAALDAWYYCPHAPQDNCDCRKPKPKLILEAARDWQVDLPASWMVGDSLRDIQAGMAAGTKTALLGSKVDEMTIDKQKTLVFPNFPAFANYILKR